MKKKYKLSVLCLTLISSVGMATKSAQGFSLVNSISISGDSTDLIPGSNPNDNRLGGFFSDLYYERSQNVYYGLADRGPGGGTISYNTRVQKFSLDVNPNTGSIGGFNLLETIKFTNNGQNYNGLNPQLLNNDKSNLGLSFDPEGFVVGSNGNFFVSDEYGPSVKEFKPDGSFVRSLSIPNNLIPKAGTTTNYVDGRPTITSGRQDNRGFEGLTITPDGSTLYAILQDPLVNEGANGATNDGRFSRNIRIVKFDVATGNSTGQYIYQLESLADINARIPGTANDFTNPNSQGRNIGVSSITAINDKEFLIIERDNRGIGEADPTGANPVGSKRVFKINIDGATDVSNISLTGTNSLPAGVTAVNKSLYLDFAGLLKDNGEKIYEKLEGLTIGPQLADGSYAILLGTDNDFSVTQGNAGGQSDVCTDGVTSSLLAIGTACPPGLSLIPTKLYSVKASSTELAGFQPAQPVPEPTTILGSAAFGMWGLWLKRRMNRKIEI